ncbi:hypothetical protein FOMPIDRAFT_87497 [Fomitopsis schrenkii]|uniref:Uncharacterized protein n=1 Tax=Fomitopsis schrenkii TaxID=2126942 RepID=S8F325_FOMSC|nr:hypothetical protein FOMPIDRAFT_87497 [Fomitopsis schrenkii]
MFLTETTYQLSRLREWLAWCTVLEPYCHVTAAKPGSLPSPFLYRKIKEMLDYFNQVFKDHDAPKIERVGVPFPTLAWSEAAVLYKQTQPNSRLAIGLPMYMTVPTYLDNYHALPMIMNEMSQLVNHLLEASHDELSEPSDGADNMMPALQPEPVHNVIQEVQGVEVDLLEGEACQGTPGSMGAACIPSYPAMVRSMLLQV